MNWMPEAIRDGIIVILIISGPIVLAAALIGLVIGVLQAATQVQEQTIGSAIKIIGIFALIIFAGFWMYQYLSQYTSRTFSTAFRVVPRQTQKVVPSDAFLGEEETTAKSIGPMKIIPPKQIENAQEGGGYAGAQVLGAPEIPKVPPVTEVLPPPPSIPQKAQPIRPSLPLSEFQEPKSIPIPKNTTQKQENIEGTENNKVINLLPGKPLKPNSELENSLLQKKEALNKVNEENNDKPSWLN